MSARPASPIGERVRKRRRGLLPDAEDDITDMPQAATNDREHATPPPVAPHTPPGTPGMGLATPPFTPCTPGVLQATPGLSPTSTVTDGSSRPTPPPYTPPSPLSPLAQGRTEKTILERGMLAWQALGGTGRSSSPPIGDTAGALAPVQHGELQPPAELSAPLVSAPSVTLRPGRTASPTARASNDLVHPVADAVAVASDPAPVTDAQAPDALSGPAHAVVTAVASVAAPETLTQAPNAVSGPAHAVAAAVASEPAPVTATQAPTALSGPVHAPASAEAVGQHALLTNPPAAIALTAQQESAAAAQPSATLPQNTPHLPMPNDVQLNAQLALPAPIPVAGVPQHNAAGIVVPHDVQPTAQATPHLAVAAPNATGIVVANDVQAALHAPLQPAVPAAVPGAAGAAFPMPVLTPAQDAVPIAPAVPQLLPGFDDVPPAVRAVVLNVSDTSSSGDHVYGLSTVPRRLDWGRGRLERRLADGMSTTYIRYGGRVRTTWFFGRSGEPQSRVNVGVNLMYDTHERAMDVLYQKGKPGGGCPEIVFASRLQGQRQRGSFTETVVPFKNVFDARDGILAKTEDRRLNAVDFTENDVIVVEAEFTRWRRPGGSGGSAWTAFDVGFELATIFLLWDSN